MPARRRIRLSGLVRLPPLGLDVPTQVELTEDRGAVTYLAPSAGTNEQWLWWHDLKTGERRVLLRPSGEDAGNRDEELQRQRRRVTGTGLTAYDRAAHADALVAVLGGRCFISLAGSPARALGSPAGAAAAAVSPDGRQVAISLAGGDVTLVDSVKGRLVRLTGDGGGGISYGVPEYIAAEELDRHEGMWWSDDGAALLIARVDERGVAETQIGSDAHRYPRAGQPNAIVELRIAATGAGSSPPSRPEPLTPARPHRIELIDVPLPGGDEYLARVVPAPGRGWLIATLARDQRALRWSWIETTGRVTPAWFEAAGRLVERATSPTGPAGGRRKRGTAWINLPDAAHVLADGAFVTTSEASGYRHIVVRGPGGSERALTAGKWVVTQLVGVDESAGLVLFSGTPGGVRERHLYSARLDSPHPVTDPEALTHRPGWHSTSGMRDARAWIDTWSTRREAPVVTVHRGGQRPVPIHPSSARARSARLVLPDIVELPAADGRTQLEVAIFRPHGTTNRPFPAVVWVYGGPHSQNVRDAWECTVPSTRQALARAGFTVIVADNRGTANRGAAFEGELDGRLGVVEVADQAAVVEALAARGEIDRSRVGVTGWSYGGYMTVRCMQLRPDLFRAGVAGAPVVAWDLYDTAYTERYLGDPDRHPDAYRRSSLLEGVGALRGPLLVIHGARDENVHPRHTEQLMGALRDAGREAQVRWLPDQRHSLRSISTLADRDRWTVRFLCEALDVPLPTDLAEPQAAS